MLIPPHPPLATHARCRTLGAAVLAGHKEERAREAAERARREAEEARALRKVRRRKGHRLKEPSQPPAANQRGINQRGAERASRQSTRHSRRR